MEELLLNVIFDWTGAARRENKKINQRIRVGRIGNDFRVA